jgi:hypothetical protein
MKRGEAFIHGAHGDPHALFLLKKKAVEDAGLRSTGRAASGPVTVHFYPVSNRYAYWMDGEVTTLTAVREYFWGRSAGRKA